jgi:hypothetical protein
MGNNGIVIIAIDSPKASLEIKKIKAKGVTLL